MSEFLNPSPAVLCKLASVVVHVEEFLGSGGHDFDRLAIKTLLDDEDVQAFIRAGRKLAMVPEMRR